MQKILTQAKHIVIFILLITVIPFGFVNGFFAYLDNLNNEELTELLSLRRNDYYKICLEAAIIGFILTYITARVWFSRLNLRLWLKILLTIGLYTLLFFPLQFLLIYLS